MSFFTNVRSDRLIDQIKTSAEPLGKETLKAVAKLKDLGPGVIPAVILALADSDKNATVAFVDVLAGLLTNKTFPQYVQGMAEGNSRIVSGIAWALSSGKNYSPNLLFEALATKRVPKQAILDVIHAQRERFTVRDLLAAAYQQEASEKAALFRIIAERLDESAVPELIQRLQGKDPVARMHIINLLSRFGLLEVRRALQDQLRDPSKLIRVAALTALGKTDGPIDVALIVGLLRDAELDVQNRAIDLLIRANDPGTVVHLVDVLKDENEYARRAAVEVLNEVGDVNSVKHLLAAMKDDDWWVRSRAGDALGKIGGPKVIDAVLQLVREKDADLRRAAIEILNQTKDERAVAHLIQATRDPDWWVSERAVDALAEIGSKRALPRLVEMLQGTPARSLAVVIRAIGRLGDQRVIDPLLPLLKRPERDIRLEAMQALAQVADETRLAQVQEALEPIAAAADGTVARAAGQALEQMRQRVQNVTMQTAMLTQAVGAARAESGRTMLAPALQAPAGASILSSTLPGADSEPRAGVLPGTAPPERVRVHQPESAPVSTVTKLDIANLRAGDLIEGRYKYVERIGKGAFGTVLLVEDTVVDERLILKFLNPSVSEDEEMMKRFVHELRYSRKITHRNVIRIFDFLKIEGHYAISMEYFPSHTLGSEVVDEKPLPLKRAITFGVDMCTGMAVAHEVGIVHRDLKPANVLINNEGLLKIVDFGVAAAHREGDTQLTRTGYVIGSPKYMAPEQILGRKVDERSDVYAIGVILYEMLTGVPPYSRGDHMAVMYQHVQGKAKPPDELNAALPPGLGAVVMKAMAVDKAKRYQSMNELREALEGFA